MEPCLAQVARAVILATWEAEIRRILFGGLEFPRPHLNGKKTWVWWFTPVIPMMAGSVK
jgi:hypothetical protein